MSQRAFVLQLHSPRNTSAKGCGAGGSKGTHSHVVLRVDMIKRAHADAHSRVPGEDLLEAIIQVSLAARYDPRITDCCASHGEKDENLDMCTHALNQAT
jgi:hypothetical protein